jgi:hypothetical protein
VAPSALVRGLQTHGVMEDDLAIPIPLADGTVCVHDQHGREWRVREVDASRVPGSRAATCLILATEDAVHRLWRYPQSWRCLPATEWPTLLESRTGARPP